MNACGTAFSAGTTVRFKNDPGRHGVVTGKTRQRGVDTYYQVNFPEGRQYAAHYELEPVGDGKDDVYELVEKGRYGSLKDFRRNLTHIQLSGRLANLVYSMDTTNTDFYAYQFKPVLSFLESPSRGLLIADEVGLGKTIEAGLIWTEQRARFDSRRLLVVCPAMLCEKWKRELAFRFGVRAEVMGAGELLHELADREPVVADGKAVICSLQGLRPPRGWNEPGKEDSADHARYERDAAKLARLLYDAADDEPLFDMVIIDESHYLRNPETQNARLGQLLRDVADAIILLSATPINLHGKDLFHQLKLVDPDFFDNEYSFAGVLQANEPLVRACSIVLDKRGVTEDVRICLEEAQKHDLLADNQQLRELLRLEKLKKLMETTEGRVKLANRIERINLLAHAVSRTRKRDVHELRVVRDPQSHFVEMHPLEKDVYDRVTAAIREYAREADIVEGFLLAGPQRRVASCMHAAVESWQKGCVPDDLPVYEDFGEQESREYEDRPLTRHVSDCVVPHVDLGKLHAVDTKYDCFRDLVRDYLTRNPTEKMVVFSYFPGTLAYLARRLHAEGIESRVLHGSTKRPKDEIIDEFRILDECRILLSSEVASEGVDLQFCSVLVNYDLPWNPMKVEQRIGRIDRVGQKAEKVNILNLGHKDTIDERIYQRLLMRLKVFEHALGGMEMILGDKVRKLAADLFSKNLTSAEQQARIDQTARAVEQNRQQQDELEENASGMIAHGGYILDQVKAAYEFKKRITSRDLEIYVHDYLMKYATGFTFHEISDGGPVFEIKLSPETCSALDRYMKKHRLHGQTRLATGNQVRCRFLNRLVVPSRKEEYVSQFHPLVRFISTDLKARGEAYHQLVALHLDKHRLQHKLRSGAYVFSVQKWSFSGLRQEELLRARVVDVADGKLLSPDASLDLLNAARVNGADWPGAASSRLTADVVATWIDRCADALAGDFDELVHDKQLDNSDRVNFQIKAARRHRDRQVETQKAMLEKYRLTGRTRMVPALEGKIKKTEDRFGTRVAQLEEKAKLRYSPIPVCFGVLDVK